MNNPYSIDFFIEFFKAIPAKQWTVRAFCDDDGKRCAVGQFLTRELPNDDAMAEFIRRGKPLLPDTREKVSTLVRLLAGDITIEAQHIVYDINNGHHPDYRQRSPRARILAALHDAKAKAEAVLDEYERRELKPISKPSTQPVEA